MAIDGLNFFVECKRLKSPQKVQRRIKDGLAQLHKRYVKSEQPANARGLLILSIGKTINSNLGFLEADNPESLSKQAFLHNLAFIKKYESYWKIKVDQRTLGVVVVLDAPGIMKNTKQIVTCHEVTINNCVPANSQGHDLLFQIAHRVFTKRT